MTSTTWTPDLEEAQRTAPRGGTISDWKGHAESLLTSQPCVYRRNGQISALYAALYLRHPALFKWAGMAAFASHHIRLALWPLRLNADSTGEVDLPRALGRRQALNLSDVDQIRRTNNDIFDDIFWLHLVYDGSESGLRELQDLVATDEHYAPIGTAFAELEQGRRFLDRAAVWRANLAILEHEQRAVVQPRFDGLSCRFARAFSFGASAGFEVRGIRQSASVFTSFYGHALRQRLRGRRWEYGLPLLTSFADRWNWIEGAVVPRFQRFESNEDRALQMVGRLSSSGG